MTALTTGRRRDRRCCFWRLVVDRPAGAGFRHLSAAEGVFLRALAGATYPATVAIPHDGGDLALDHYLDDALQTMSPTSAAHQGPAACARHLADAAASARIRRPRPTAATAGRRPPDDPLPVGGPPGRDQSRAPCRAASTTHFGGAVLRFAPHLRVRQMSGAHLRVKHPEVPRYPAPQPGIIRPAAPARGFEDIGPGVALLRGGCGRRGHRPAGRARAAGRGRSPGRPRRRGARAQSIPTKLQNTARYHMQEGGAPPRAGAPSFRWWQVAGWVGHPVNSALHSGPPSAAPGMAALLSDPALGPESVLLVIEEVERWVGVCTTPEAVAGRNNMLLAQGAEALGLPGGFAPRSTPGCRGCGICNFGCLVQREGEHELHLSSPSGRPRRTDPGRGRWISEVIVEGDRAVGVRGHAVHPETQARGGRDCLGLRGSSSRPARSAIPQPPGIGNSVFSLGRQPGSSAPLLRGSLGRNLHGRRCGRRTRSSITGSAKRPPPHLRHRTAQCLGTLEAVGAANLERGLAELPHPWESSCWSVTAAPGRSARLQTAGPTSPTTSTRPGSGEIRTACGRGAARRRSDEIFAPVHGVGRHSSIDICSPRYDISALLDTRRPSSVSNAVLPAQGLEHETDADAGLHGPACSCR